MLFNWRTIEPVLPIVTGRELTTGEDGMEARLALLFREVLEKCGTMSANAFVAVELTSGERLWAANGPFKEEFRNQVGVRHCMCARAPACVRVPCDFFFVCVA